MTHAVLLLALVVCAASMPQAAPTAPPATGRAAETNPADRLFDVAIAAVGPIERAPFVQASGSIETGGERSELEVLWSARAPRRVLVRERLADGGVNETGCDGARGWMRVAGRDGVRELEPAAVVATCAPLVPSLMIMAVADRFPSRSLGPTETIDGVACRRVDLEDRDGLPGAAWFDVANGRLRAFRTRASRATDPVTTTIEAWTQAGLLTVPARLVSRGTGPAVRTTFTRVDTAAIPDAAFRAPLPAAAKD